MKAACQLVPSNLVAENGTLLIVQPTRRNIDAGLLQEKLFGSILSSDLRFRGSEMTALLGMASSEI